MNDDFPSPQWLWVKTIAIIGGLIAAWFFMPRKPSLQAFDPVAMGKLEADMWHCYYDRRYAALEWDLYLTAHDQYGFSPWESTRMAYHASQAASAAQPVQSRAEAYAHALPHLQAYYSIIHSAVHLPAPVNELAEGELNWWVLRREHVGWKAYAQAISDTTAKLYGVPESKVHDSAFLRAEMMDYRDQHREGLMTPADWTLIGKRLGESYGMLKEAVR